MTDTATTSTPAKPRQAASRRPQVSVRPALVGAANAAVIGGATAVTAGGGLVLAAAGAGVAAVGAAAAARKGGKARAAKMERSITFGRTTTSGGGVLPRAGRSSAGTPGARSGGGSGPGSRSGSGLGSLFGKNRGGAGSGGGGRSGGAGRSGGQGAGGGRNRAGGGGGSGRPGSAGHRKAGSRPGSSSRSPLSADKVAAARRKLAARRQPGPRLSDAIRAATSPKPTDTWRNGQQVTRKPTAREAWSAARRAVTGDNPKMRGTIRRAVAGVAAAAVAADKAQRDRWKQRKRREAARQAKTNRIQARQAQTRQGVATAVRRAPHQTVNGRTVKPAPQPIPRQARRPTTGGANSSIRETAPTAPGGAMSNTPSAMAQMLNLAEQMVEVAAKFERPSGVMELLDREYAALGQVQRTVAKAWKVMHVRATDPHTGDPLPPIVMELLDELQQHQLRGAATADQIVPLAKRLEQARIDALADPRNRMWDHRANQEHTG